MSWTSGPHGFSQNNLACSNTQCPRINLYKIARCVRPRPDSSGRLHEKNRPEMPPRQTNPQTPRGPSHARCAPRRTVSTGCSPGGAFRQRPSLTAMVKAFTTSIFSDDGNSVGFEENLAGGKASSILLENVTEKEGIVPEVLLQIVDFLGLVRLLSRTYRAMMMKLPLHSRYTDFNTSSIG